MVVSPPKAGAVVVLHNFCACYFSRHWLGLCELKIIRSQWTNFVQLLNHSLKTQRLALTQQVKPNQKYVLCKAGQNCNGAPDALLRLLNLQSLIVNLGYTSLWKYIPSGQATVLS